ncbi:hypothetical protein [Paraliomyxa miuraensis]|uniref:hypothetical protein n=1 Tax=Paraliomyxa miuraensis TaxID=376150 RepID=UPI0022535AA3|nr:hypothetical protein [Paraliomyxa miuraensis]MCX4243904.1 hypothetical protein [Paraliomyxa miuraensis]
MASDREVNWTDIERAAALRDPQLASLVIRYMDQPDPPEDRDEDADPSASVPAQPRDAWTLSRLKSTIGTGRLAYKTADEQRSIRRASWDALMASPHPPPRLRLGTLLAEIYEQGDEPGRAALEEIFARARVGWGLWQALKRIFKLAEERHDASMFGVLAWRLDAMGQTPTRAGEISPGTFLYMQRRAWRFLRELGRAVPEAYPQFAVQILRRYPRDFNFWSAWVVGHIWGHELLKGQGRGGLGRPPTDLKKRAYPDAWKRSPDPLLRLLEDADNNEICQFAIRCITTDFPERLRAVEPAWLARLGQKPLASVHDFVTKLLRDDPRFHPSKLASLGLHELALSLLRSDSDDARKYAVEYVRAHVPELPVDLLVTLATEGAADVRKLAAERLEPKDAKTLGLPALVRLLGASETAKMAEKKLKASFGPDDIDAESFIVLWTGNRNQQKLVTKLYEDAKKKIPARHWLTLLEDKRLPRWKESEVLRTLGSYSGQDIGIDWIKQALLDRRYTDWVGRWLQGGMLKGDALDVDWVKGLVMRPRLRAMALAVLGNPKLCKPTRVGLPWLLAMVRQADESLHRFAHRYMLEHFSPSDFKATEGGGSGLDKLWGLAAGPDEPETVRTFAGTYLRVHHPTQGATMQEAKDFGIKPRLSHGDYALARVRPLFDDGRADVRKLAQDIAKHELVRWGDRVLPYRLAHSRHREARAAANLVLLKLGHAQDAAADADYDGPPADWLLPDEVFMLAEASHKATREVGLTLIRRCYDQVGGARRLAWLMESPDREVRLFAVRLLWEKHRPGAYVSTPKGQPRPDPAEVAASRRFDTTEALREFLRTVMFGLPPGRMERREHSQGDELPDRPLPASVAKARLVAVIRDFGLEDRAFAELALPVLEAFAHSEGKGERHGCIAALATLRHAHPGLVVDLPTSSIPLKPSRRPRLGAVAL